MRGRTGATAVTAALTVALATVAHVLAGGTVPASAWPLVAALGGVCFLVGLYGVPRPVLVIALGAVQLGLHLSLASAAAPVVTQSAPHPGHHGPAAAPAAPAVAETATAHGGHGGAGMLAAHLGALLVSMVVLRQAHRWWLRLTDLLGRVRRDLPRPFLVVTVRRVAPAGLRPRPFAQRWLPADARRRGPPFPAPVPIPT